MPLSAPSGSPTVPHVPSNHSPWGAADPRAPGWDLGDKEVAAEVTLTQGLCPALTWNHQVLQLHGACPAFPQCAGCSHWWQRYWIASLNEYGTFETINTF